MARRAAASFSRLWSRGISTSRVQGIRYRLGLAMSLALLPILLLGAVQAHSEFNRQAEDRRTDLRVAAERTAQTAKARLDLAMVLLSALAPESVGPDCALRLEAAARRLDGYDTLYRIGRGGQAVCNSTGDPEAGPESFVGRPWFERLRQGEEVTLARTSPDITETLSLVVGVRWERPRGAFAGAMAAVLPISELQPDVADPALPRQAQAALTDAMGRILVSSDARTFLLDGDEPTLAQRVARARPGETILFEGDDIDGVHRDYAATALAGRDVYVVISAPSPGLLSWARLNPISVFLLPLLAWVAAFSAVLFVSERIVVRWLQYLERIASLYARGRYSVRPVQAAHAPAEIHRLAQTLDELADAITARDSSLKESLSEKDALMREIHHRVKNNLQIISSLLSIQQRALKDGSARAALGDTRQRIAALALIYRTLYQSDDIRHADSRIFLTELVGQMIASEAGRGPLVTSSIDADSLIIDPDKLAPLALWLVEAVTNAQKHAFAGRGGTLEVRFRVQGDTSVLEVQDDGPMTTDSAAAAGVGRTLMEAFAKQLRGKVQFIPAPGQGMIARMTLATPEAVVPSHSDDDDPREADPEQGTPPLRTH